MEKDLYSGDMINGKEDLQIIIDSNIIDVIWYSEKYKIDKEKVFLDILFNNSLFKKNPNKYFNLSFFIKKYRLKNENPILFYLENWKNGFVLSKKFNSEFYLKNNKDILNFGIEPLAHFLEYGHLEKRETFESEKSKQEAVDVYPFYELIKNTEQGKLLKTKKNIAIIAEIDIPQCKKYRVLQMKTLYEQMGYKVSISDWRDFWKSLNIMQLSTSVVFYRVPYSSELMSYIKESSRLGISKYYDIDDPIFNSKITLSNSNLDYLKSTIKKQIKKDVLIYSKGMMFFDAFIVSTVGLQKIISKQFNIDIDKIVVRPNFLDRESLSIGEIILNSKKEYNKKKNKTIIWNAFFGS